MKEIYVVRHCKAGGQEADAPLTEAGRVQAEELSGFFADKNIERIVSSPFRRAIQSAEPLSKTIDIPIETDERLAERILSIGDLSDWLEKLEATFHDPDLAYDGGESSREAMERIVEVVEGVISSRSVATVMVTHGNLMALLLNHVDNRFGFEEWKQLSNPDVFVIKGMGESTIVERVWKEG